ncbi:Hypothetical protein A7982_01607 [Minicystis rosea]|nr:Hypothetical protein A7982_01607 [Minicystis rosea]
MRSVERVDHVANRLSEGRGRPAHVVIRCRGTLAEPDHDVIRRLEGVGRSDHVVFGCHEGCGGSFTS